MKELIALLLLVIVILIIYGRKSTEKFTLSTTVEEPYVRFYAKMENGSSIKIGPKGIDKTLVLMKKIQSPNAADPQTMIHRNITSPVASVDLTSYEGTETALQLSEIQKFNGEEIKLNTAMSGYYLFVLKPLNNSKISIESEDTRITKPEIAAMSESEILKVSTGELNNKYWSMIENSDFKTSDEFESTSLQTAKMGKSKPSSNVEQTVTMATKSKPTHSDDFMNRRLSEIHKHLHENM